MIRLNEENQRKLKRALEAGFPGCVYYFFGSRCNPEAKGGDIDVAVVTDDKDFENKKLKTLAVWELMEVPISLDLVRYGEGMDELLKTEIDRWQQMQFENN